MKIGSEAHASGAGEKKNVLFVGTKPVTVLLYVCVKILSFFTKQNVIIVIILGIFIIYLFECFDLQKSFYCKRRVKPRKQKQSQ